MTEHDRGYSDDMRDWVEAEYGERSAENDATMDRLHKKWGCDPRDDPELDAEHSRAFADLDAEDPDAE